MRTRLGSILLTAALAATLAGCPSGNTDDDCDTQTAPAITHALDLPDSKGGGGGGGKGGGGGGGSGSKGSKGKGGSKTKNTKPGGGVHVEADDDCDED